jgi:hypothetical protein
MKDSRKKVLFAIYHHSRHSHQQHGVEDTSTKNPLRSLVHSELMGKCLLPDEMTFLSQIDSQERKFLERVIGIWMYRGEQCE